MLRTSVISLSLAGVFYIYSYCACYTAEVLPPNWQAMQPTEPLVLVSLDPASNEYKVVLGALYGTHGLGVVANVQSVSVWHVDYLCCTVFRCNFQLQLHQAFKKSFVEVVGLVIGA